MTVRDVGDGYAIEYQARDPDGTLVAATVALAVTDPSGNTAAASPTNPSLGIYRHTIDLDEAGLWHWTWTITGNVQDKSYGNVEARNQAPPTYASVPELRTYQNITDGNDDSLILAALTSASREIDKYCGRRFYPDLTATARRYYPTTSTLVEVADFYTTTGLAVATDTGDDATYETAWATTDYQLEPLDGIVDGESGWPHCRIRAVEGNSFPTSSRRAPVQVTARWGWSSVPDLVHQACLVLAGKTFKFKDAPFGVSGTSEFGIIRARDDPRVAGMLQPYRRSPVKVG